MAPRVNKIDSFVKNMALHGPGIGCSGKKVNQPFGKKNACEEAEGFKSAKKVQQATQASVHWQNTRKTTKQNNGRSHPSSALLSASRFRIPVQFFLVLLFSTTVQRLQPTGDGQNTDPQSIDYPNGLPKLTTLKWITPKNNIPNKSYLMFLATGILKLQSL